MASPSSNQKIVVIGAGPVGALAALYAARRGHTVEVYELRGDLRNPSTTPLNFTKSINLALSERGINSLRQAQCPDLLDNVLAETIPMHGRMIHGRDAKGKPYEQSQKYDAHGRCIRAVDRAGLNKRLLDELEKMPQVTLFFEHKLTGADFKKNLAWFHRRASEKQEGTAGDVSEIEISFDFMIGADGAHSAVRYHLMKFTRVNYQQEYIDTLWCEFQIPALPEEAGGGFRLSPNHLHIWPGGEYMFIAIPSQDHTFTCTLFLPATHFTQLATSHDALVSFFDTNFPGVTPDLIDPTTLQAQFDQNPHLPLVSIKCTPYHYGGACVILGDAAHAMVPFYGQGMNAGLEDVRVLFEFLDAHASNISSPSPSTDRQAALAEYTAHRTPDAHTINALALSNYEEMRSSVTSPLYKTRKWIEEQIDLRFPSLGWQTQYSRVSFENQRYSDLSSDVRAQKMTLEVALGVLGVVAVGGVVASAAWVGALRRGR
ncbi:MAG: kynurenine 3-monooxygenase, mitochondrial precursor [Thelocarpon superellum]|nr:MAG: kynurenine 3-monooxygenase, mitochondrial precursor [Thelocarpon superellum]